MIAFGPVPSRRLGFSVGINNIPPKHCPYSCIYCQVGRTDHLEITRQSFYPIEDILQAVEVKIAEAMRVSQEIDFLTFVAEGEPTSDQNIREEIEKLKTFGYPIAVISNASLLDRKDVRRALLKADWVSLKIDCVVEKIWRKINRPDRRLNLEKILTGICEFRAEFKGELITETMLVAGENDSEEAIIRLANFLAVLQPFKSYLSIPTRPPAEPWVKPPAVDQLKKIIAIISEKISFVDLLFDTEGSDFKSVGNLVEDILSITAVHPIREEALRSMVIQAGADWMIVEELIIAKKITFIQYKEERFYLSRFHGITSR